GGGELASLGGCRVAEPLGVVLFGCGLPVAAGCEWHRRQRPRRHDPRAPGGEGMNGLGLPPVALLAGVDEVGRGPLAGDVVAAAVILDPAQPIPGLADSKALSEKRREALYPLIVEGARAFHVARATVEEIDRLNILKATLLAMTRAVEGLGIEPEFVAVDGNRLPRWR